MPIELTAADDLAQRAVELAAGIAGTRQQLRKLLLAGGDTAATREFLADLEREAADVAGARAEWAAETERAAAARIRADAGLIAEAAVRRLADRVAALEPPPTPALPGRG